MFLPQDVVVKHAGASTSNSSSGATVNSTAVDLTGCEFAIGIFKFGAIAATGGLTSLKVQVSDAGSTYTDVLDVFSSATFSTGSGQTALTMADTDDNKHVCVAIDLRNRPKKYVRWSYTHTAFAVNTTVEFAGFIGIGNKQVPPSGTNANQLGTVFFK